MINSRKIFGWPLSVGLIVYGELAEGNYRSKGYAVGQLPFYQYGLGLLIDTYYLDSTNTHGAKMLWKGCATNSYPYGGAMWNYY